MQVTPGTRASRTQGEQSPRTYRRCGVENTSGLGESHAVRTSWGRCQKRKETIVVKLKMTRNLCRRGECEEAKKAPTSRTVFMNWQPSCNGCLIVNYEEYMCHGCMCVCKLLICLLVVLCPYVVSYCICRSTVYVVVSHCICTSTVVLLMCHCICMSIVLVSVHCICMFIVLCFVHLSLVPCKCI